MKLLITGDWHICHNTPINRIDNLFKTQNRKLSFILDTAIEEGCKYILQPGDFYNTWKIPHHLERYVINKLKKYSDVKILTIFGQHDLRYHSSDKKNTPLSVLEAAKVVTIIQNDTPICLNTMRTKEEKAVYLYGVSWKEKIPTQLLNGINILSLHDLVTEEGKGWEKKKTKVHSLFDQTDFDLMVTGDNHKSFAYSDGERHLINCGSLMRSHIDQEEHQPYVYVYDTEINKVQGFPVPVEPFVVVMNVEKAKKEKKENETLGAFVKGLKNDIVLTGLDFKNNLWKYMKANKIRKGISNILNEVMGGKEVKREKNDM